MASEKGKARVEEWINQKKEIRPDRCMNPLGKSEGQKHPEARKGHSEEGAGKRE